MKMSSLSVVLIILCFCVFQFESEEKFCENDRGLLLTGVFNYEDIIFAYNWKGANPSKQYWLVWTYKVKGNRLVPIGKALSVPKIFPGLDFFRAGFGLTLKCDKNDAKCQSYRQLVFIFFQNQYKVFRFANNTFRGETDKSKIPWALKTNGEVSDWFFGNKQMVNVYAIMFSGGSKPQIFLVSNNSLFVAEASIKATSLKWRKLSDSQKFNKSLGGFVVASNLLINRNEEPDNFLLKYDQTGKLVEKISVWNYFDCDNSGMTEIIDISGRVAAQKPEKETLRKTDDNLAAVLLICIVVSIVLVDIIVAAFWLSIYKKNKNPSED